MEKAQEKIKKNFEVDTKIVLPIMKRTYKTREEKERAYNRYCNYIWGLNHFELITVDEACDMITKVAEVFYASNS